MKASLEELQALVAVIDAGSITAAAERQGQAVSGISRALSRLEEKLDTTLVRRTTRRLELTDEGALFLAQARRILAALDEAEEQLARRRLQPAGRLRINAASPFMLHVIVPLMADFHAQYPQIALELNSSDEIIDLIEQRTDVAIRIGTLRDSSLHARALGSSRLRVQAAPSYLRRHGEPRTVEALAGHRLLGFTQPESLNVWPLRQGREEAYAIAPSLLASSGETLRQLALAGQGVVCLADFMTAADRAAGTLMELLSEHTVQSRQPINAVYYRNTALVSRIACFLDFLAQRLDGHRLSGQPQR